MTETAPNGIKIMKHRITLLIGLLFSIPAAIPAAGVFYPIPGLVDQSTGMMESKAAGNWYRGSAVITRDPKLIYSCAHLFFERGRWATDYIFHRAYHNRYYPDASEGVSPRGLHYFTSYSSGVDAYGSDSNVAFASDFTVLYGNSDFGPAVGFWTKGGTALRSGLPKRVVGYPSDIDYTGESGRCYQHATGWFDFDAFRVYGSYHEFERVSTGPGNSGGPVFVQDSSGNAYLAGILVAGTRRTAGAVALDLSTNTMAGYALGLKDQTRTFSYTTDFNLPDGASSDSIVDFKVSGFSGSISKLGLSVSIATQRRGDLNVYLRSPGGRMRWISRREAGSGNLEITGENLTSIFRGFAPNGTWQLHIRDAVSGARATFQNAALTVSAL